MGNWFAYAVLAVWPLIAIYLYKTSTIQVATLWTIVGGFMFLPVGVGIDLPLIPGIGKQTLPIYSALIGCWFIKNQRISYIKELGKIKYLVILFLLVPFINAHLNSDIINVVGYSLPRLTYYDGLSSAVGRFIFIIPFFMGRQFFRTYDDQLLMFKLLVVAGLFYSLLMLFEVRMSPQLHTWFYGFFPHSFMQQYRYGGFRPVVFMGHGLLVSFFTVVVLISATALWNNRIKIRQFSPPLVSYYLLFVLVLCKSVASLLYGVFSLFLIKGTKPKTQHRMAVFLVCLAMFYPVMSIMKVFPHQAIINIAESIDPARAQSLSVRFNNEKTLLNHARERVFFGWGGWGRNRIHSQKTGEDISTTDGGWVLTVGTLGMIGFLSQFGLLAITVFRAYTASKLLKSKSEQTLLAAHAILVGMIMIDQLPNSSLAPWLWLLAGILLGRSEDIIYRYKLEMNELKKGEKIPLNDYTRNGNNI